MENGIPPMRISGGRPPVGEFSDNLGRAHSAAFFLAPSGGAGPSSSMADAVSNRGAGDGSSARPRPILAARAAAGKWAPFFGGPARACIPALSTVRVPSVTLAAGKNGKKPATAVQRTMPTYHQGRLHSEDEERRRQTQAQEERKAREKADKAAYELMMEEESKSKEGPDAGSSSKKKDKKKKAKNKSKDAEKPRTLGSGAEPSDLHSKTSSPPGSNDSHSRAASNDGDSDTAASAGELAAGPPQRATHTPPPSCASSHNLRCRALLLAVSAADSIADSVRSGVSLASSSLASATAAPTTVAPTSAAAAQKVSLQLSVQGGSSQDAPCKLSFTVSKAADAPAAAEGEVKKRWGDEEAEEPQPVDDAWEVVPSKANKKAKKQQQQQQQDAARARPSSSATKGDSRPTQQPAPAPAPPQPARRAWDTQPSKPEEPPMRRGASEGTPNGQGAATSAWQNKPAQATPTQSAWKGQTQGSGASSASVGSANGCSDSERERAASDGSSSAAPAAQPRPVQWPALDGAEKPAVLGKTPAENASTISVAAMVGAASTACATVIHAAAAASGVVPMPALAAAAAPATAAAPAPAAATPAAVGETAPAASEPAPVKSAAAGGSWASLVVKNIDKKSEGKAATNTKGFTVLTGPPATCVNSASSAAPAATASSNATDASTTDSVAAGTVEAAAASDATAAIVKGSTSASAAENAGAASSSATDESLSKPAGDSAALSASSTARNGASTPACSSTAPPAAQQQRHESSGSSAGAAAAAVPTAPPPARRAWGQNDPRPASLILPKSADTKSNAASAGASGAPSGACGAAGGSAQNGMLQNGGASANAGAASYSQAAAPPRPASAPPANDANGKQANMRGGGSTNHAGGGGRGGVPLQVPGPYGLQALQAGMPQMNFMAVYGVQNAQALAHYADISGGIGGGEPSDASGSGGAGPSEEHGASHAFDAWVEATTGLPDTSARGRKNVGRGGRGQGGRGQGQQNGGFAPGANGNIVQQQQAQSQQNQAQRQRNARMQQNGSGLNGGGNNGSSYQHMPQQSLQQLQLQQLQIQQLQIQQGPSAHHIAEKQSKLHEEIVRSANKNLEACESSHAEVQAIKTTLLHVVTTRWKDAKVEMYGSRSTGLYLASSDMDVVLLDIPVSDKNSHTEVGICLKQLHDDLASLPWVVRQTLIPGARIPVLKILSKNNISVDVTISASELHTGLQARDLVLGYLHQLPQLAPLVVVLKSFLRDLSLNDVYSGGLSSYCLVVLLFQFMRECETYGYPTQDCGHLLVGFLNNFLWRFESNLTHVDDPLAPTQYADDGITIIRPGENIMHSCYQIGRVCHHFKRALNLLSPEYNDWENTETQLLAQIFGSTRYTQTDEREHATVHAVAGRPTPERHATPDPERGNGVPAADAIRSPPVLKSPPLTGVAGDDVPAATAGNAAAAGSTAAVVQESASPKAGAALEEGGTSKPLAATPAFEVAAAAMAPDAPSGTVSVGGSSDAGEDESAKESAKVLKEMVNSIEAVMPPGTASIGTQVAALDGDLAEPERDEAGRVQADGAAAGDTPSSSSEAPASAPEMEEAPQPSET